MKTKMIALMLSVVSIALMSCSGSNPAKDATEEYMNTKSLTLGAINEVARPKGVDVKMELMEWNNTPIDTITKNVVYTEVGVMFLEDVIKKRNQYESDSIQIAEYEKKKKEAVTEYRKNYYEDLIASAKIKAEKHKEQAELSAEKLKKIVDLKNENDVETTLYYVYKFTEQLSYEENGKDQTLLFTCYSYIDAITNEAVYVQEGTEKSEVYSRYIYALPFVLELSKDFR